MNFLQNELSYDTIRYKSLTRWTKKAECDQLNLAHETKTNIYQYIWNSLYRQAWLKVSILSAFKRPINKT